MDVDVDVILSSAASFDFMNRRGASDDSVTVPLPLCLLFTSYLSFNKNVGRVEALRNPCTEGLGRYMSIGEVFLVGSETRGRGHDPGSPHTPRGGGENLGSPVCKSAGPRDSRSTTAATDPDDDDLANTGVTGSPSLV